jgi:hypothetical protein
MDTLFELPPRQPRKRGPRTQQEICKRCKHSASDEEGAYCRLYDLCIEFSDGLALTLKDCSRVRCDYGKPVEQKNA